MKFNSLMQNDIPNTAKYKPEVEFKYGGRFFFQTGNSSISAVD